MPKRKMNFVPMIVCSLVPWALFVLVYSLMAFQFHYSQPTLCNIVVFVLLFFVLVIGVKAGSVLGWHLHERTMICHTRH